MEMNTVLNKSKLLKGGVIIFLMVLAFYAFKGNAGVEVTGNAAADPYSELSFQKLCAQTGGMWMRMQPTQNYVPTGQQACLGCMQRNGDHICEKERYIQALQKQ